VRWTVHGERAVYESPWMTVTLADVEIPGERRFEHHVLRMPCHASGVVIEDPARGVLLLWRHRFTTDTWGWEVPAGRIDPGETPVEAGEREAYEETGWRPGPLTHLTTYFPHNGTSDATFHLFRAEGATYVSEPIDTSESERVEWRTWDQIRDALAAGEVGDGLSMTALLWVLAMRA